MQIQVTVKSYTENSCYFFDLLDSTAACFIIKNINLRKYPKETQLSNLIHMYDGKKSSDKYVKQRRHSFGLPTLPLAIDALSFSKLFWTNTYKLFFQIVLD